MDKIKAAKYIKDHCLGSEVYRDGTQWNDAMVTAVELLERPELKELSAEEFVMDIAPQEYPTESLLHIYSEIQKMGCVICIKKNL